MVEYDFKAYLKTHSAIVVRIKCIEQKMCICCGVWNIEKETSLNYCFDSSIS